MQDCRAQFLSDERLAVRLGPVFRRLRVSINNNSDRNAQINVRGGVNFRLLMEKPSIGCWLSFWFWAEKWLELPNYSRMGSDDG